MIGNRVGIGNAVFPFRAVTTVDINSQKVFEGVAFGLTKRVTYTAATLTNITFDAQAVTKDRVVLLPISFKAFGAGPINIDVYFGGDYSDNGTQVGCFNRDGENSNTCDSIVRLNPTINTKGTKLPLEFVILSNGTPAVASLGGDVIDDFITLLRKDGKYLIELDNTDSVDAVGWFGMNFFEVDKD